MSVKRFKHIESGGKPKEVLSALFRAQKELDVQDQSVILKAKAFKLISIPSRYAQQPERYIDSLLDGNTDEDGDRLSHDTVYCVVLSMRDEMKTSEYEEMTGRCRNNENIHKGGRKWVTKYVVYEKEFNIELEILDGKTEAMKWAKEYAIDKDRNVYIELEKRLDGSQSRIADIEPIKKTLKKKEMVPNNRYIYFGLINVMEDQEVMA